MPAKSNRWIPLLIVAAAIVAYQNSFRGDFIFDDIHLIPENPHIRHLWPLQDAISETARPVVQLSLAFNYALSGLNVWSYHAFNLTIHILAALTLFGVVRRTLVRVSSLPQEQGVARWLALVVATLWAVHPLCTESVSYIIQRGESLMGLWYLFTLYAFIRSLDSPHARAWLVVSVIVCALGMATKPIMVTAPVIVFLYDLVFVTRSVRKSLRARWGYHAALVATWGILPPLLANAPAVEWETSAGFGFKAITPSEYALTQPGVILHYLRLSLWPDSLCFDYRWPVAKTAGAIVPPLVVLMAVAAATVVAIRRWPSLGFLGLSFLVLLIPSSSFIPIADTAADHRMYLPLATVLCLVVVGGNALRMKLAEHLGKPAALRYACIVVVLLAGTTLIALTRKRNEDYSSSIAIWNDVVTKRPLNARAQNNLGFAYFEHGRLDAATEHYLEALRMNPDYVEAHYNLGVVFASQGKNSLAIDHYSQALRVNPNYVEAHTNLGAVLAKSGRLDEAAAQYREAIRLNPGEVEAHNNLGNVFLRQGRIAEAASQYQETLRLKPDDPGTHYNFGLALVRQNKRDEALEHFKTALKLNPNFVQARQAIEQFAR